MPSSLKLNFILEKVNNFTRAKIFRGPITLQHFCFFHPIPEPTKTKGLGRWSSKWSALLLMGVVEHVLFRKNISFLIMNL